MSKLLSCIAVGLVVSAAAGLQAQVTVDFRDDGTFTAPFFEESGLVATSVTGVGLLELNGIGVAGGLDDYVTEAGETLFVFLPYMCDDVIVDWGELINCFDYEFEVFRNGVSLGAVQIDVCSPPVPINLNMVFGANAIDGFTITGIGGASVGDHLGSITFTQLATPATQGSFSPTGFEFSASVSGIIAPMSASFYEIQYDGCAPLIIDTFGTGLDTEIALFDEAGFLIRENDDAGGGLQSEMVFFDLDAGTYFLAVGLFDTVFFDGFGVSSFSGESGAVSINVTTPPRPFGVTVDFTDDGTFVTSSFEESGLIATSATGVGLLELGGIGVAGGLDDFVTEAGETLVVSLPYLSSNVELVWFGNSCFNYQYEAFRRGVSLGVVQQNWCVDPQPLNLNSLFEANAIDAFTITGIGGPANGDFLSQVSFEPAPDRIGTFFPDIGYGYSLSLDTTIEAQEVVFYEILYDGIATLSIDTFDSTLDTELAFYNECGALLAQNDDAGGGLQSELAFENLEAGRYFLAVGLFDSVFGNDFDARSFAQQFGEVLVTVRTEVLLGDVNRDNVVNLLDVDPFIDRLTTGTFQAEADTNQDGLVNLLDVEPFVTLLSGG